MSSKAAKKTGGAKKAAKKGAKKAAKKAAAKSAAPKSTVKTTPVTAPAQTTPTVYPPTTDADRARCAEFKGKSGDCRSNRCWYDYNSEDCVPLKRREEA